MTIREILRKITSSYEISPIDREILLSLATNLSKENILAHPEKKLTKSQVSKYEKYAKRKSSGEPTAYITGRKEFFSLEFIVDRNVLIPRPETELVVEEAIKKIQNTKNKMPDIIIDVGTGSGNIIISMIKNISPRIRSKTKFFAFDISRSALKIARANAKRQKVDKKIKFVQSDILEHFLKRKENISKNIFIVANLPYVSSGLYKRNHGNLKFEPKSALVSTNEGLHHYKKLFKQIQNLLSFNDHCSLIIEISPEQKFEIGRIIKKYLPKSKIKYVKDLAGKWRIVAIEIAAR